MLMAKEKSRKDEDQRKPYKFARVRQRLARLMQQVSEEHDTDFTEEVNRAVREYLERLGKWPPDPKP